MNLTFVLDTSGSMAGLPIAVERATVLAIAENLRAGDVVSMVTWNTANRVMLDSHQVTGPSDALLVQSAQTLQASGGTDLNGGLVAGYFYLKGGRIHLLSEIKYRYLKWRVNRMRRKFDVYSGGRSNPNDRIH